MPIQWYLWTDDEYEFFRNVKRSRKLHKIDWKKYDKMIVNGVGNKELMAIIGCGEDIICTRRWQLQQKVKHYFPFWETPVNPVDKKKVKYVSPPISEEINDLINEFKERQSKSAPLKRGT